MRQVIAQLERIRRRSRAMLLVQRLSVMIAWMLGLALALVAIDYLLRLPGTVRLVLLVAGGGALAYAIWTYLRPAVCFRPSLTEVALRAEGTFPAVAGRLASSVEFAASNLDKTNPLARRSVAETEHRLSGESLVRVLSTARTGRGVGIMLSVAAVVTVAGMANPSDVKIGLARLFVPYGLAQWPARTGVESLMSEVVPQTRVHPRGRALPLRARVTKGDPDHVDARYRLRIDSRFGPWQRIVLTAQVGGVHERLVDTTAQEIELYFETPDARTGLERIALVAPPAVRRARLTITPPAYASAWYPPLEADLGPGLDERAVTDTPSLIGSAVRLVIELNKALPVPQDAEQLAASLGWGEGELPSCSVDDTWPTRWTISWRLAQTRSLSLQLVDEYGLSNAEPIAYRIEAVEDRPPSVTIIEPESDEPVLATAVVPLATKARDDVAVATTGIEASLQPSDRQPTAEQPLWETSRAAGTPMATLAADLDLATLDLAEGDIVLVRGVGEDVFDLDGQRHPVIRSPARRLRIISELDLAGRLRRELGVVRQNAIRIEVLQAQLQDDVVEDGPQPGIERAQAQIGERIAAQRQAVNRIAQRMGLNRLVDERLAQLVQQAGGLLDFAGRAANRAVDQIERRRSELRAETPTAERSSRRTEQGASSPREIPSGGEPARDDEPPPQAPPRDFGALDESDLREPAEQDRPIVEAQQEVREELTDLITLLDRDEDAWVATHRLENLMEAQTRLEVETGALGRQTVGRSFDELTPAEQSDLGRIAERQRDLAEQGRQLIEDLHRRADALDEADHQAAAAMRAAATTGERGELAHEMDNAADRVSRNQMGTAQTAQQAARRTLQRMLADIRETKRASAQELLRRLASLIESIQRLIAVQESELSALARARDSGEFVGRDRAMIRLNQNTQAVAAQARSAGQEARRIARVLNRAADAQGAAVAALRGRPLNADDVTAAESRSLELLEQAKQLAEELLQTVEQAEVLRQREEIIAAFRQFAEREVVLRSETLQLAETQQLDRRRLIEARRLGRIQDEIRLGLDELRAKTRQLHESLVFSHVHELLDDWARQVTDALVDGEAGTDVTDREQQIADGIGRLAEALEDLLQPLDQQFASQSQSPGGGGGAAQPVVIPPLAELLLLRGMQEQVYNLTREIDSRADLAPAQRSDRLRDLGRSQRVLRDLGQQILEKLKQPSDGSDSNSKMPPQ